MDTIFDNLGPILLVLASIIWIYFCFIQPHFDEEARLQAEFDAHLEAQRKRDEMRYLLGLAHDGIKVAIKYRRDGDIEAALQGTIQALLQSQ